MILRGEAEGDGGSLTALAHAFPPRDMWRISAPSDSDVVVQERGGGSNKGEEVDSCDVEVQRS